MKKSNNLKNIASIIYALTLALIISCSTNEELELDTEINGQLNDTKIKESSTQNNLAKITCDTSFPALGPSSTQTCADETNPVNKGTLDCRTSESYGGFENTSGNWGSYKIKGGTIRYNGTKTRVERRFKTLSRGSSTSMILSGKLRIVDLSDGKTCIMQSHATGKIVAGLEIGQTNKSAQFLLYAKKITINGVDRIRLERHITSNPYTTTTGGSRTIIDWITIDFRTEYDFTFESGYSLGKNAFTRIKVDGKGAYMHHTHTTEKMYTRYGAYGTGDTGDITAHVKFKDIDHCRD